jgi:hypothetical protein
MQIYGSPYVVFPDKVSVQLRYSVSDNAILLQSHGPVCAASRRMHGGPLK